ncbi:MAG: hypothetical protein HKN04_06305 [Rhodothermaceae bacterium]|nr:hypothetical protein [Rhodothermaceae bacterium]
MPTRHSLFLTFLVLCISALWAPAYAQSAERVLEFFDASGPIRVQAEVVWGVIRVTGHDGDDIRLSATHTPEGGSAQPVADLAEYVTVQSQSDAYSIRGRRPRDGAFESIDLTLAVPARADVSAHISRGGEVIVEGINGVVDISQRNGSVVLRNLGGAALVNALNGSIEATFRAVDPEQSLSFIALNGGIDLTFPGSYRANVRLRTERNGYITSEFSLPEVDYPYAAEAREGTAKPLYSQQPIEIQSTINGGGPVLVATTENGPIHIRRRRR